MEDKEFNELLEALGKDKKEGVDFTRVNSTLEEETVPKSRAEIKAHKADPKTYFDKWMAVDESEKL